MPTLAALKDLGSGVWAAEDAGASEGFVVDLGGGVYAIDDEATSGLAVYIDDDGETVYIETTETVSNLPNWSGSGRSGGSTLGGRPGSHRSPFTFARRKK